MVARWGILWKPLDFSLKNDLKLLRAITRLHNFCMENSIQRGEAHLRQVSADLVPKSISEFLGNPCAGDSFGERLQNEHFVTAPTARNTTVVHVDNDVHSVISGDDSRRQAILLHVTALNLQRPLNLRARASDLTTL